MMNTDKIIISHSEGCNYTGELSRKDFDLRIVYYCPVCFRHIKTNIECNHVYKPVDFELSNGARAIRLMCSNCYELTPKAESRSKYEGIKIPKSNLARYHEFKNNIDCIEGPDVSDFIESLTIKANQFNKRDYQEYLQTDHWKQLRKKIMDRDNNTCQICGVPANHVHHMTYVHRGNEYEFELVALCYECHKIYH